jgi:hypothetical protein
MGFVKGPLYAGRYCLGTFLGWWCVCDSFAGCFMGHSLGMVKRGGNCFGSFLYFSGVSAH